MDCGCGAQLQTALLSMRARRQGNLGVHMGSEWGKRMVESSFMLFCCPMLAGDRAEQDSAWSASTV